MLDNEIIAEEGGRKCYILSVCALDQVEEEDIIEVGVIQRGVGGCEAYLEAIHVKYVVCENPYDITRFSREALQQQEGR